MELRLGGPRGGARAEREEHGLAAARRRGRTGEEPRGTAVERDHGGEGARGRAPPQPSSVPAATVGREGAAVAGRERGVGGGAGEGARRGRRRERGREPAAPNPSSRRCLWRLG